LQSLSAYLTQVYSSSFTYVYLWSVVWSESVHFCVSLFYVCYWISVIPIPPTTQYIDILAT